jgi:hypothetical protein
MAKANDFMLKADRDLIAARFEKRCLAWEKTRQHGMVFYVLIWWILRFGGIMSFWFLFFDFYLYPNKLHGIHAFFPFVLLFLLTALMGFWDWHSNEKHYRRESLVKGHD